MATNLHSETENAHVAPNLDQFPAGLRILVVDDDIITLKIIEQMSIQCHYHVTTCIEASVALNLLREGKDRFDVVLSDVHMPDMDGYKFLQHVDQEFNIPVIMMSVDESTSSIMEGIRHGASHYLIKPVHEDDLRNIWQHIVRKTRNQNKEQEDCGGLEVNDPKKGIDDPEYISSAIVIDANEGIAKDRKKRSLSTEGGVVDDNPSPNKKRFVWTPERHQIFVDAVLQLGIDKAVPKRILALMNIPDLTRENVASHLQKFRLHMKKKSGEVQLRNGKLNRTHAGHVSPQTQPGLHAELTCSPADNKMPKENQVPLVKSSPIKKPNHSHAQSYGISKCDSNVANNFPQPIMAVADASSGYGAWEWPQSNTIGSVGLNSGIGRTGAQNGYMLMNMLHHHQMQEYQQKQQQMQLQESLMHNQIHSDSINIQQPSYLTAPSLPSETLQVGNSPSYFNHNYSFGRNSLIDYRTFSPQMNNSLSIAEFPGGYNTLASVSPPVFGSRIQQLDNSTLAFGAVRPVPGPSPVSGAVVPYGSRSIDSLYQGQVSIETQPHLINSTEVDHPI